jgi:transglutaminase-like putative cysteine protease
VTPTRAIKETGISEGVTTFGLILLLFFCLAGSIAAADWTDGLGILGWAVLAGLACGWVLAKLQRVRGLFAHLLIALLTVPVTGGIASWLLPNTLSLHEKLFVLQDRMLVWLRRVLAGGSGSDGLVFVIQLLLLTWLLAYSAAWFVYRQHQVWGAILPSGIALLINLFYAAPQADVYFGLYLLGALLLLVRMNLFAMEKTWRRLAIGYTSDVSWDVMWSGVVLAIGLLVAVWAFPASAPNSTWLALLDPLQGPWQQLEEQFTRAFSTLRAHARPGPAAFFGATLTMGGPVNLSQQRVMDVRAENGRYWRAMVFDQYGNSAWVSTHLATVNLNARDALFSGGSEYLRAEVTQTVTLYLNHQNILYAQAQPLRFSVPIEARVGVDKMPASSGFDLTLARARHPLREGGTYTVVSAISVADESSLRSDTTGYSEWITANYLQLPNTLPERIRAKAQAITAGFSNPYDKAVALEKYLRAYIRYDDQVSAPPPDMEAVEYVLFERPAGYCNYYASAMAVMARAVGIPARVVSGYTPGEYSNGVFHIVEANAHSWVEVFFPHYGWIEFEPTANKPEIDRPKQPQAAPQNPDVGDSAEEQRRRQEQRNRADEMDEQDEGAGYRSIQPFWFEPRTAALLIAGVIAVLTLSPLASRRWRRLQRIARLTPAARVYEEMLERARWLGVRDEGHATPLERARAISAALPGAQHEAGRVAAFYSRERFGARPLDVEERATLTRAWEGWRAAWWRGLGKRVVESVVRPTRTFLGRTYTTLERWNNRENFQS